MPWQALQQASTSPGPPVAGCFWQKGGLLCANVHPYTLPVVLMRWHVSPTSGTLTPDAFADMPEPVGAAAPFKTTAAAAVHLLCAALLMQTTL